MTPECSSCGYIVEFVRSCKVGVWRLFRDRPDITTTGRYVRVPPDTPHLPFPHNFWSNAWVRDTYTKPDDPLLGDVSPRVIYDKGIPDNLPPAVALGSADCFANGESWPQEVTDRRVISGFNSSCWSSQGLIVPDQTPTVWLRNEELPDNDPVAKFSRWRDFSPYGNDAYQQDPTLQPRGGIGIAFNPKEARFTLNQFMPLRYALTLQCDYAVMMVGRWDYLGVPIPDVFPMGLTAVNSFPFRVNNTNIRHADSNNIQQVTTAPQNHQNLLWSVFRIGSTQRFRLNNVLLVGSGGNPLGKFQVTGIGSPLGVVNNNPILYVAEVLVFAGGLTLDEEQVWANYLITKFSL